MPPSLHPSLHLSLPLFLPSFLFPLLFFPPFSSFLFLTLDDYFLSSVFSYLKHHLPHPYFLFFSFIFISWRLITLQYCSGFCHTLTWIRHGLTCGPHPDPPLPPPSPPHPSGFSQCTSLEHLSHASNLGWWSVSHLIIYMFRCCSLRSSYPHLLP